MTAGMIPAAEVPAEEVGVPAGGHDVVLVDGSAAEIRRCYLGDKDALAQMYSRVSSKSLYRRFFGVSRSVVPADIERVTRVGPDGHVAVVALLGDEIIGLASYELLADEHQAELSVLVDDLHQGLGVGRLLVQELVTAAVAGGVTTLIAEILPNNVTMLHLLHHTGYPLDVEWVPGVMHVELDLRAEAASSADGD